MTNIITFTAKSEKTRVIAPSARTGSVISIDDWRAKPHPIRTATGVFFVTNMWGNSGDAA